MEVIANRMIKKQKIEWALSVGGKPWGYLYETKNNTILMSWISAPVDGVCKQLTGLHTCRETFIKELRNMYAPDNPDRVFPKIETKKLRAFIARKKVYPNFRKRAYPTKPESLRREEEIKKFVSESDVWMKEAKRCLNLFEKRAGWVLTTVRALTDAEEESGKSSLAERGSVAYAFTGSSRWMKSPQLLSLYFLIIRLCGSGIMRHMISCEDATKLTELEEFKKVMATNSASSYSHSIYINDFNHLKDTCNYWTTIIDHHKYLFDDSGPETNFKQNNAQAGITKLSKNDISIEGNVVGERWSELLRKLKKQEEKATIKTSLKNKKATTT